MAKVKGFQANIKAVAEMFGLEVKTGRKNVEVFKKDGIFISGRIVTNEEGNKTEEAIFDWITVPRNFEHDGSKMDYKTVVEKITGQPFAPVEKEQLASEPEQKEVA